MQLTRIFAGSDGESHFEEIDIPLQDLGPVGAMSELIEATGVVFRETGPDYDLDWHNAPRRQFVLMLSGGEVEIEVGDGSIKEAAKPLPFVHFVGRVIGRGWAKPVKFPFPGIQTI